MQSAEFPNTSMIDQVPGDSKDLTLVLGGPVYQFYLRTKLAEPALNLVLRRVVCISLICWLPLLVLTLFSGQALGGVTLPFLLDLAVYVGFLVALPLLIVAEPIAYERIRVVVRQFSDRGIIAPQDRPRFNDLIASSIRIQNSAVVEAVLLVVVVAWHWFWKEHHSTFVASTWFASNIGGEQHLTPAGYWYAFVSLPILRFILLRWYFRLFVWYRFLWHVRALPLHFNLFHPDRAGGLGFLAESVLAFASVLFAQAILLAGIIGDEILYAGAKLPAFRMEIVGAVVFLMLLVLVPLCFFLVQLEQAGRKAKLEYGILASHYVEDFHRKWVEERGAKGEDLLGTSDIQSLADLGNAFNVVSEMRLMPFGKSTVIRLAIMLIFPFLPLTLTMLPLEQIIARLMKLVF